MGANVIDVLHQPRRIPSKCVPRQQTGRTKAGQAHTLVRLNLNREALTIQLRLIVFILSHRCTTETAAQNIRASGQRSLLTATRKLSPAIPRKDRTKWNPGAIRDTLDFAPQMGKCGTSRSLQFAKMLTIATLLQYLTVAINLTKNIGKFITCKLTKATADGV